MAGLVPNEDLHQGIRTVPMAHPKGPLLRNQLLGDRNTVEAHSTCRKPRGILDSKAPAPTLKNNNIFVEIIHTWAAAQPERIAVVLLPFDTPTQAHKEVAGYQRISEETPDK